MRSLIYALSILVFFTACKDTTPSDKQEASEESTTINYKEKGRSITDAAFSRLSQNLMKAMQEGGVPYAVDYCHVEAYPITDSVSSDFEVSIRRTSAKYRNPENKPNAFEAALINHYEAQSGSMQMQDSLIVLDDGSHVYARPILLQEPCLNCHGTVGKEVKEEHYAMIKEKYSEDKAIGYSAGDFRGLWMVTF